MAQEPKNYRHRILRFFDVFENVFALSFAIGLFLLTKEVTWSKVVIWVGIIGLTFIYLIRSFESPKENIGLYVTYKLMWLGYILALFGIYSRLELLEKSLMLIYISIGTLVAALLGITIFRMKSKGLIDAKDIVRLLTFLVITFLFSII